MRSPSSFPARTRRTSQPLSQCGESHYYADSYTWIYIYIPIYNKCIDISEQPKFLPCAYAAAEPATVAMR